MTRIETLHRNTDFRTLYYRGRSQVNAGLVTYARKNGSKGHRPARMGITVTKKVGTAVQRNRCRRIIREAYRQLLPQIPSGWDFVFVARTRTLKMKSTEVQRVMEGHLKKLGVIPT